MTESQEMLEKYLLEAETALENAKTCNQKTKINMLQYAILALMPVEMFSRLASSSQRERLETIKNKIKDYDC